MKRRSQDQLAEYRRKRTAERTPEPFSGATQDRPRLFVVQKHAASRMHYDLRLELDGVLQSWAVPKGPSLDPAEKRLAVLVEEHPLEYADFEGLIPEGNYGAGAVIVWDRGRWVPIGDPGEGLRKGKLLFDLEGYKLRGRWTLFRIKGKGRGEGQGNEWLLMKKPDGEADPGRAFREESIRSGLTVEQLRDGHDPAPALRRRLTRLGAPDTTVRFAGLKPMLARARDRPFDAPGWLFELKYDGYRLLALLEPSRCRLGYRRGSDATATFPEIAAAVRALPFRRLILDGEVVVPDARGRPSFQRLQRRVHLDRRPDVNRATVELPAVFFVFDLLGFEEFDLRPLPLVERKRLLREVLPGAGPLRYCDHVDREGKALFAEVEKMRLEGLMAKRADSPYRSGRSADWLKIRALRAGDFAVVGYSAPQGSRTGFGALHLAVQDGAGLVYAGRVGSGFTADQLERLHDELQRDLRPDPPCRGSVPEDPGQTWVEPRRVCEVRYKEWTAEGLLRQPVFLRERDDKTVEECTAEDRPSDEPAAPPAPPESVAAVPSFTNLDKVFWPEERYTKGDLIEYYRSVSAWLLPYLRDRPIVLTRYPDGIDGKSFFQKDAPAFVPDWIRTERMWSEHAKREIHYFVADDERTLLYLINLGTIPLHLWSSRLASLQHPDWCILDLDPKEAPFRDVVRVARAIRALCEEIGLASHVKSSGSTGLHVLLPLGGQCTYEQSRALAELLARVVAAELPDVATIVRSTAARGARVYIDYLQNGHGRLLVSPYSVRPLPGAPVSAPLRWSEVGAGLDIRRHTIRTMPRRLRSQRSDPLLGVLSARPDLTAALGRLERRWGESSP